MGASRGEGEAGHVSPPEFLQKQNCREMCQILIIEIKIIAKNRFVSLESPAKIVSNGLNKNLLAKTGSPPWKITWKRPCSQILSLLH
jgi:hypothetical protein